MSANDVMKSPETLAVARVIPHPWKEGETRNIYEFPVTRKIVIEADTTIPADEILKMAARCHDREIGLEIVGGGYRMTLSSANAHRELPPPTTSATTKESYGG